MMNGVLVVDKPEGCTSHDVVTRVKRALGARKVGHLGTLDPRATGVLPLVVDGATRFARWLECGTKEYKAELTLGVETDTYDGEGRVTASKDTDSVKEEDVHAAFGRFKGRIMQIPPMYSSVKRSGVPLYKLARKGITVDRPAKEVEIFSLNILDITLPRVKFTAVCSKGTYIRSLCKDIGDALGYGAHLSRLRRIRSGGFSIDEAIAPDRPVEELKKKIIPLDEALVRVCGDLFSLTVDEVTAAGLTDGGAVPASRVLGLTAFPGEREMVRFMNSGSVVAVGEYTGGDAFNIKRVFARKQVAVNG